MMGDLSQAESSLQSAIALYEETFSRLYQAIASMDLGNVYLAQGQPDQAEALYRRARDVMERTRYVRGLAQVFNNLGMACTQQQKWELAEDSFRQSISHWRQLGEPVSQANAEDNLAEVYLQQEKWQAAWEVASRALERLSPFEAEGRVEALLSDIHEHLRTAEAGLVEASA
jgi:tetratricopeptide (TPR) repeat protein